MKSIEQLYQLFQSGMIQAKVLLEETIKQHHQSIEKNAIACLSPLAMKQALQADLDRKNGRFKGFLHGIPILIKDNIMYADGTPTTANSYALKDFIPQHHAKLVQQLLDAGAVIAGKANLSEFAYFMGDASMPSGYGSMYGQVKHPFDEKIDPYGSSTGSAVAVALGMVAAAIGTETNGSLMAPAYQCQIVAFKPTFGLVSNEGIIPISPTQDTAGPMAKHVVDCAILMDVLIKESERYRFKESFYQTTQKPIVNQRVGILRFTNLSYEPEDEMVITNLKARLNKLGIESVEITMTYPTLDNFPTLKQEFKVSLNAFLSQHTSEGAPKSLASIIAFNQANASRCLKYGQQTLLESEMMPNELDDNFYQLKKQLNEEANQLNDVMNKHQLSTIITPLWLGFAPIAGMPSVCIPEGVFHHIPKASVWIGRQFDDPYLLQLAHAYERVKNTDTPFSS